MALKQFLQNLFERAGLAEAPMAPPGEADVVLSELEQMQATLPRLAAWGIKWVRLVVTEPPDVGDLVRTIRQAAKLEMGIGVRGRASDLIAGKLLDDIAAAGVCEIELPNLSAVAEVHDALAGIGDHRCMLKALDLLSAEELNVAAQLVLTPSTWKTIARTMEMLVDRGVRTVRVWPVACRDDEPSSWAFSPEELIDDDAWLESHSPLDMKFTWYPPLKFDPARTLAQQVRRGPRASRDAVRVEADGSVIPPVGPATPGGNVAQNDWKLIARCEVFRAWKRRRDAVVRCEQCPGLAACTGGCLRDEANWAVD
jgi:radical SAM protein with 4Fe4S-binding SPASM domain